MRRKLAGLFLSVAIALSLVSCTGTESRRPDPTPGNKIRIGATTLPGSAPIYIAEELGYFEDEGLDVSTTVYDAGALALQAAVDGEVDYATAAQTPIARAAVEEKSVQVLMTICEMDNLNYIVARKDRGIAKTSDLIGKRVGFVRGTTGDFFLHIYLTTSRIPLKKVREVPLTPQGLVFALTSGRVDAVSTWIPYTVHLERALGDNAVVLDEPGLYTTYWSVVTGASKPDAGTSRRLIRAIERANRYMAENPDKAIALAAPRCGMSVDDLTAQWPAMRWKTNLDQTLILAFEDEARWILEDGHTSAATRTPDFLDYIDAAPLTAEDPSKVTVIEAPGS